MAATLIGRKEDAIIAAITTTVLLIVVAVSPQHAWLQPILRFADTIIGVAIGIVAAWSSSQGDPLTDMPAKAPRPSRRAKLPDVADGLLPCGFGASSITSTGACPPRPLEGPQVVAQ